MEQHKNVFVALAAAQMVMEPVKKNSLNPGLKGDHKPRGAAYADLSEVLGAVLPALNSNGMALFAQMITEGSERIMRTVLVHGASDTRLECDVPLIVSKNDMQGLKSAITYAKRIGAESLTGVAPEDDDGNAAVKPPAFDPGPHIDAIRSAPTGKALLGVIPGSHADHPAIKSAVISRLQELVAAAPSITVLDAMARAFDPEWPDVAAVADERRAALAPKNADLGSDVIPF